MAQLKSLYEKEAIDDSVKKSLDMLGVNDQVRDVLDDVCSVGYV